MSIEFSSGDIIAIAVAILSSITSICAIYLQSKQHQKDIFVEKSLEIQGGVYAKLSKLISQRNKNGKESELDDTITYCLQSFPYLTPSMWSIITDLITHINNVQKQNDLLDEKFVAEYLKRFKEELIKRVK